MAKKRGMRPPRGDYEVGYKKPPRDGQFPPGKSPNPGGKRKSDTARPPDPGPSLGDPVKDAVLKVMGEMVSYEGSAG